MPLKLTTAEQKLILDDLLYLDQDYEQIIRQTGDDDPQRPLRLWQLLLCRVQQLQRQEEAKETRCRAQKDSALARHVY